MASTPNPTSNYSSVTPRPSYNQNQNHNNHRSSNKLKQTRHQHRRSQSQSPWSTSSNSNPSPLAAVAAAETGVVVGGSSNSGGAGSSAVTPYAASGGRSSGSNADTAPPAAYSSSLGSYPGARKSILAPEFSGKRSTRFAAKMHSGKPRILPNKHPHTKAAEEALHCLLKAGDDSVAMDNILFSYEHKLWGCDDYMYLLKEFANSGHLLQAEKCYNFGMCICKDDERVSKGKLTSTMIGTLGRLGRIKQAFSLFEDARLEGHGNTVHSFSAMITAFGRNRCFHDAVEVFKSMPTWGLQPNVITYNAIIDAGAKSQIDFDIVVKFFDDMVANNWEPDRVTYNSLLSTCAPKGLWELAQSLLREMNQKGIDPDLFTYNTYLDTMCKGGKMDLAKMVLEEMPSKRVWPNVVTFSTMMDGYAKANRLEDALNLYDEMKRRSIFLDRVSYNTMVGVYAKLGRFDEAVDKCKEMERCGIRTDVVTYNALLCGYGKHAMYAEVKRIFEEMKTRNIYPNTLTYSTLIDVYTKGGMFLEAMDIYREFKEAGLEVDVVFYSALVDALCKNGLVESSIMLLDAMIQKGIRPNVVTYNSIIDAFGQLSALERGVQGSSLFINGIFQNTMTDEGSDRILKMFEQLAAEKAGHIKKDKRGTQDQLCILWIFRKMHELNIKPNVVTFSAILNACSRCNSFEDASKLLDELRLFDNQVYGVAHGLLMGYRDQVWYRAQSLFNEIRRMDLSTASAFYNALTDMLWHFGQRRGAQMVVLEGRQRNVWKGEWSISCLDLHLMSCGAASAMVHAWLLNIHANVYEGCELPQMINILTGWGKHSKVVGDGILKKAIEALLDGMGSPFKISECNIGRFVSPGYLVASWLRKSNTHNLLALNDVMIHSEAAGPSH